METITGCTSETSRFKSVTYERSDCANILKTAKTGNVELLNYCVTEQRVRYQTRDGAEKTLAHLAANHGHLNVVQWCVKKNKDFFLDAVDALNNTLLHAAVRGGSVEVLDYVAHQRSTLLHRPNGAGFTVLHKAAALGRAEIVVRLVEHWRMWPSQTTSVLNYTPALLAAKHSHIPVLNWLLESDFSLAHAVAECNYNLLHWATYNRLRNVTGILCEKYRVEYRDNCDGDYPMHVAYRMGSFRTGERLVEVCRGSELQKRTLAPYNTVAHEAAIDGHTEALKQLDWRKQTYTDLVNDLGQTPTMLAAENSRFQAVRYLIGKGASINFKDKAGNTILHYTACNPYLSVVKYLWGKRRKEIVTQVNATNEAGETSVYKAALCDNLRFIEYVLEKGSADLNTATIDSKTALTVAVERNNLKMVEYLLQRGADTERADKNGLRALDHAKSEEMKEIIRLSASTKTTNSTGEVEYDCAPMLDATKEGDFQRVKFCILRRNPELVDIRGSNGETLAQIAAANGHFKLAQWLLNNKKRFVNEEDSAKNTLLHAAARGGSVEIIDLVATRKRSLLSRKNDEGWTALHVAVAWGRQAVVANLVEDWGMWPNHTTSFTHNTAALIAAKYNRFRTLEWFLEKDASLADMVGECQNGLLHWTAAWDNAAVAELLCRKYKLRSRSNCVGDFPVHVAFRHSSYAAAEALDKTCHAYRDHFSYRDRHLYLLQPKWRFPNNTVAHEAAQTGNLDALEYLDSKGMTGDYAELKNELEQPPIFVAVEANQLDAVDFLIAVKNVALHWKDTNGNTVFHMTACNADLAVLQYLEVEHPYGMSTMLNEWNYAGETLLYKATACDNAPLVRYLIYFLGADTQVPASDNTTALLVAIGRDNFETVKLLLGHGYQKRAVNGSQLEAWEYARTDEMREFVQSSLRCPTVREFIPSYVPPQMPRPFVSVERERRMVRQSDCLGTGTSTEATSSSFVENGIFNNTLFLLDTLMRKVFGRRWYYYGSSPRDLPLFSREMVENRMDPVAIEAVYRDDQFGELEEEEEEDDDSEE